jgi:hypothetical protein
VRYNLTCGRGELTIVWFVEILWGTKEVGDVKATYINCFSYLQFFASSLIHPVSVEH